MNERLTLDALSELSEALLDIDEIASGPSRRQIMSFMRTDIRAALPDLDSARAHVIAWLRTCSQFRGGHCELVKALMLGVPDNEPRRRAVRLLDQLWPLRTCCTVTGGSATQSR